MTIHLKRSNCDQRIIIEEYYAMNDLNFSGKQPRMARKLCKQLKKQVSREPISEWFNWKSSAVIAGYASSKIRFSFAKAVYVYPQDDGWTADVEFQRGRKRTIIGAPDSMPLKTRTQAIRLAKTVLQIAREFEQKRGKARGYAKIIRPFDLCGHMIEPLTRLPAIERGSDDDDRETAEGLIAMIQAIFYNDFEGNIDCALKDPAIVIGICILNQLGYFHVPADPEREREKATIH